MVHAGVHERLFDALTIDDDSRLIGVLFDDREQIAQQPPLSRRQLGMLDRCGRAAAMELDAIDRLALGVDRLSIRTSGSGLTGLYVSVRRFGQLRRRGVARFRNLCPSSYRCA